jgi:hypothetical protein
MYSPNEIKIEFLNENREYADTGSSARGESSPINTKAIDPCCIDIIRIKESEDGKAHLRFCYPNIGINPQGRYETHFPNTKRIYTTEEFIHLEAILDAYSPNIDSALWDLKKQIVSPENIGNTINKISNTLYFHFTVILNKGIEFRTDNNKSTNNNIYRKIIHYDLDESVVYFNPKKNIYIFGIKQGPLRFLQLYLLKLLLEKFPDFFKLAGQKTSTHEKLRTLVQNNIISEVIAERIKLYYDFLLCIHAGMNQDYLYTGNKPIQYKLDIDETHLLKEIHEFCISIYRNELSEI